MANPFIFDPAQSRLSKHKPKRRRPRISSLECLESRALLATLPGSSFEIDYNLAGGANFVVDTPGNKDWANAPGLASPLGVDIAASSSDNAFGQGTNQH